MIQVRLLGGVELIGPVSPGGPKARAILAMLVLARQHGISLDRLIDGVWGEDPPTSARNTLQVHVSGLRKALAATLEDFRLHTAAGGYRLELPDDAVDVRVFERAVSDADAAVMRGRYDDARDAATIAIGLCHGQPLAGLEDAPFAAAEVARLDAAKLVAYELWADATLATGRPQDLSTELERVLAEHPFSEALWRRHILGLYRCGRQAEALAALEHVRKLLADELGLDPSPDLIALQQAILRQDPALQPDPVAPSSAAPVLPWFGNPLVGRVAEVDTVVSELLKGVRVLTVLGPGGVGKTRLAVEATRRTAQAGRIRTAFVDVTSARSPDEVVQEVARVLGARGDPPLYDLPELLTLPTVVTIDNVDQVATTLPAALGPVLAACPCLHLLITSRVATGIDGEERLVLGPLPDSDAAELFADRARKVVRTFTIDDSETADAVRAIAHRVDALPLALELAAARLRLMPLQRVREHLEQSALTLSGSSSLPAHHRSVRQVVQWSAELLEPDAAAALRTLAVCEGGFTLETAEAVLAPVAGDVLQTLADLVDNSLLVGPAMEEALSEAGQPPRFRLLQPIRDYGLERLDAEGETAIARARLAQLFLGQFADEQWAALHLDDSLARLGHDLPNLVSSIEWLLREDPAVGVHLLVATVRPLLVTGNVVLVRRVTDAALRDDRLAPLDRARVGVLSGVAAYAEGDRARALEQLGAHLPALMETDEIGYPLVIGTGYLVASLADEGRHDEAAATSQAAIDKVLDRSEEWVATILDAGQYAAALAGDIDRALVLGKAAVDNAVRVGDRAVEALRRETHAITLLRAGLLDEAVAEAALALQVADGTVSSGRMVAAAIPGRVHAVRGQSAAALACLTEAARGDAARGYATREMGWLALALAPTDPALAARCLGAALAQEDDAELPPAHLVGDVLTTLEATLPDEVEQGRKDGWLATLQLVDTERARA